MDVLPVLLAQLESGHAAAEFVRTGLLGTTCVVLSGVVIALWRNGNVERREKDATIAALQALRVADAQAVTAQLLKTNSECTVALTNVANAMDAQREGTSELRTTLKDLADEIRMRRPQAR